MTGPYPDCVSGPTCQVLANGLPGHTPMTGLLAIRALVERRAHEVSTQRRYRSIERGSSRERFRGVRVESR